MTCLSLALALSAHAHEIQLQGQVPNPYEDAALEKGRQLGIGSIQLAGPKSVTVLSHQTFTLQYTAGPAGIKPGGGIRIGLRHLSNWSIPQTDQPAAEGYMTIEAAGKQPVQATVDFRNKYFAEYFAWHNMIEVLLPDRGLKPGETLRITLGDTSHGSPGIRVQPFDESCFIFKTFVDALGDSKGSPINNSPVSTSGTEGRREARPGKPASDSPSNTKGRPINNFPVSTSETEGRREARPGKPASYFPVDTKYLPLAPCPAIEIIADKAVRLSVVIPSNAVTGKPTWCLVRAEDRYGNPAPTYNGTIHLTSTDPKAALPNNHTFTPNDRGVFRFEPVIFKTSGIQTISASDGQLAVCSNPVHATHEPPAELLLWGDIHGHTLLSDGRGTVEEYYDFAENVTGLDFCAVSDHAFELVDAMWEHSKKITNQANKPGRFVTFQAYEWSGTTKQGGDHNCYFLDDDPPLYRSTNYYCPDNLQMGHDPAPKLEHITDVFAALNQHLSSKNVICIPHFGGRRGNPQFHDHHVQRLIEIFSEHRRSEDWATTFLSRGHRLGIMASSDGHFGNPGHGYLKPTYDWKNQEIGMAALAVRAKEHTRKSIFHALYDRHVYATSGDRILLDFTADNHPMGSEFQTTSAPLLQIEAVGTAPITRIEIKKNSQPVHTVQPNTIQTSLQWQDPAFDPKTPCYYYVRIQQQNNEEAISSPIWLN